MIKKIKIEQLRPGMFIYDLNCAWLRHPFIANHLKVKSEKTIVKIGEYGIREVYIDTERGLDVADAPTREEVDREIQYQINKIAEATYSSGKEVPLKTEIVKARQIKKEAKKAVQNIMEEVRIGKRIKTVQVEEVVDKMVDSIFRNQDALISLGRIKKADEYTYIHSMSVCVLMISFGRQLGFEGGELREVGIGAMLHDIGKMKVPPALLNSKRKLTDHEFDLIKRHVEYGQDLLKETPGISDLSVTIAAQHHERVDGKGYPAGLKGDEISLCGQAAAVADVYDAMTSQRCYQRRYEPTEVLKKLFEWDELYNKSLVQQFIRCVGIYPAGSLVQMESGLLGVVLDHGKESLLQPTVRIIYDTNKSRYVAQMYDIDLASTDNDRIKGYELPDKWDIHPEVYL